MLIRTLAENTSLDSRLGCQHGLSLYIETGGRKVLFDMGADGLFTENASKMGVDLASVDVAFISHGHSDHGGGLKAFL
jgi:7,8-dihydropterin-6-yl-methyl-4-(beta-D-ribofuranosyl)aminobenzene 5'-phosphate synthase